MKDSFIISTGLMISCNRNSRKRSASCRSCRRSWSRTSSLRPRPTSPTASNAFKSWRTSTKSWRNITSPFSKELRQPNFIKRIHVEAAFSTFLFLFLFEALLHFPFYLSPPTILAQKRKYFAVGWILNLSQKKSAVVCQGTILMAYHFDPGHVDNIWPLYKRLCKFKPF